MAMIKCFCQTFAEDFFPKQNVEVQKSRHSILSIFLEIFCCFTTLNTELKNLLSGFDFARHYFEGAVEPNIELLIERNIIDNQGNSFKQQNLGLKPLKHTHPQTSSFT